MDRNDNNDNQVDINHLREEDTFYLPAETGISHRRHHFWPEIIVISINQCLFLKQSKPNLKLISHFGNLIFEIKLILEILGNYSVAGFEMVLNRKVNFTDTSNFTNFNQFRFKVLKKGLKKIFCSPLQSEKLFCFC